MALIHCPFEEMEGDLNDGIALTHREMTTSTRGERIAAFFFFAFPDDSSVGLGKPIEELVL